MKTIVNVKLKRNLEEVLLFYGYICENQNENIILIGLKNIDAKLIIIEDQKKLYFQLDIIEIDELLDDINLYKDLLSLNYDLVPLSISIDKSEELDSILILTAALDGENLSENELIKIIRSFEEAIEKIIILLKSYFVEGIQLKEGEIGGLY